MLTIICASNSESSTMRTRSDGFTRGLRAQRRPNECCTSLRHVNKSQRGLQRNFGSPAQRPNCVVLTPTRLARATAAIFGARRQGLEEKEHNVIVVALYRRHIACAREHENITMFRIDPFPQNRA